MTRLSATQLVVLTAAAQRTGHLALRLPSNLRGGAATKVVGAMIAKGLLEEVYADKGDLLWQENGDGRGMTLVATDAGLAAIGIEPEAADSAPTGADEAPSVGAAAEPAVVAEAAPKPRTARTGTKQAMPIEMLRAETGATIEEIVAATGWRPHTLRGAIAGALKKKLGLAVTSEKVEGRGRVYRLPPSGRSLSSKAAVLRDGGILVTRDPPSIRRSQQLSSSSDTVAGDPERSPDAKVRNNRIWRSSRIRSHPSTCQGCSPRS
jgi:hypothetical protein